MEKNEDALLREDKEGTPESGKKKKRLPHSAMN